mmetsp:Transcript_179/g.551  ORF Transcript_179/g.551 Transcript_179/m.551 type:complete len:237 (-) Transcript_179:1036-1746(-)
MQSSRKSFARSMTRSSSSWNVRSVTSMRTFDAPSPSRMRRALYPGCSQSGSGAFVFQLRSRLGGSAWSAITKMAAPSCAARLANASPGPNSPPTTTTFLPFSVSSLSGRQKLSGGSNPHRGASRSSMKSRLSTFELGVTLYFCGSMRHACTTSSSTTKFPLNISDGVTSTLYAASATVATVRLMAIMLGPPMNATAAVETAHLGHRVLNAILWPSLKRNSNSKPMERYAMAILLAE